MRSTLDCAFTCVWRCKLRLVSYVPQCTGPPVFPRGTDALPLFIPSQVSANTCSSVASLRLVQEVTLKLSEGDLGYKAYLFLKVLA